MPAYDIDLTLDSLKIPNINGTFPFGTKITPTDLNKGGLSTAEVNSNIMMPFMQMRPKVCTADSTTSQVEYDAKIVFNAPTGVTPSAGYTLTMGDGTYIGCTVTYTNLMEYACTVKQSDGTTTLFSVPAGKTMSAMWTGTAWRWTTTGSVTANDPTPVSSAAVHAAIGDSNKIIDLSSQITEKISIISTASLVKSGHVCVLTIDCQGGPFTFNNGQRLMKLPVKSKSYINAVVPPRGDLSSSLEPVFISLPYNDNTVVMWWITGNKSNVDYKTTLTFMTD